MSPLSQAWEINPPFPRNYAQEFLVMERGKGSHLWDRTGRRYLDFGSGIAVNALGYGRSDLARIASRQMKKLIHASNLFTTEPAVEFARALTASGPWSAVHFGNSGAEANEGALKYARAYALRTKGPGHHKFLCFSGAFHGRTLGALSVTPSPKYQAPFAPLIPDVYTAPYNDLAGLSQLDRSFAAVILEPIQGEGGLASLTSEFARELQARCAEHDILIIADEIQTGLGRTGDLYAHTATGLQPDILTLSKPLAGGLPLSATLLHPKVNEQIHVGDHGTTFGGGPVTCALGLHVWKTINAPGFLDQVKKKAALLNQGLKNLVKGRVLETRGRGLLQGLALDLPEGKDMAAVVGACRDQGLLVLRSGTNVLRLAPPLIIQEQELSQGLGILEKVLRSLS